MIEELNDYNNNEKEFIIKLGLLNYKQNKIYFENNSSIDSINKCILNENDKFLEGQLEKERQKVETLSNQLVQERNNFSKVLMDSTALMSNENKELREGYMKLSESMMMEIKNETTKRTSAYEQIIQDLKQELFEKRKEIQETKSKQGSAAKGIEFEQNIYNNIIKQLDILGNNWEIIHIGQKLGGKGDIIMEHKDTRKKIMIDPKNHQVVPNAHKEKFLRDIKDKKNGFDAAIMVSNGKISGKRCFERVIVDNKIVIYISNYEIGQEGFIMSVIEDINKQLTDDIDNNFDKNIFNKKMQNDYERIKRQKALVETQLKMLIEQEEQIMSDYFLYFNKDIELETLKPGKKVEQNEKKLQEIEIFKLLDNKIEKKEGEKIELIKIHKIVNDIGLELSNRSITQTFNKWRKERHEDKRKQTKIINGYNIKGDQAPIIIVDT